MKKSAVPFLLLLFILAFEFFAAPAASAATYSSDTLQDRLEALSPMELDEVLWLARCIYSESNLENEQQHIAWVVRNRVDTKYRGETYREVILEPLQFSIFNDRSQRRDHILGLNQNTKSGHWKKALKIALDVHEGDPKDRPFSIKTRHFYSPISMKGNQAPDWAKNVKPIDSQKLDIDPHRFLFFEKIDESEDPFTALKTPKDHIASFQDETRERLQPKSGKKPSLRERWKPSGRVTRPARPGSRPSTRSKKRNGW